MKIKITLLAAFAFIATAQSQNMAIRLCDFDTVKKVSFADYNGVLDTLVANPSPGGTNTSSFCARYIRSAVNYDNIKLYVKTEFTDVAPFAQANTANKLSLNILSTMPIGTRIEIQVGARQFITYPEGIHSVYSATTTVSRQWETLNFNLTNNLSGNGGFTNAGNCNKLVVLFNPNSTNKDTIYFDDVMGPQIKETVSVPEVNPHKTLLSAIPNPSDRSSTISFNTKLITAAGLTVTNLLGRKVGEFEIAQLEEGLHSLTLDTSILPEGIYFYTLTTGSYSETKRLVVSH